ncbi:protein of unknown function DUF1767 [Kalmanozyma brasiliensis GHG001]|uniref:RecQ-mediated genome instability protein 1 n=1 Tax=Kalmanozyma brasiliensis (strain GHG001) TaxID=1365824 RepID=V5ET47_KALBG|nr:protein of unknown function DUF1767 [Kalmanozyma brasiliensis GHG001]EST08425.1 protein of unknown function DUF1767 [Kalmanozyma brasiliensis GHG001]
MSNEVPPAVTRLLSARYPTLDVDPTWLTRCVNELRQRDASLRAGTPDQLARAVRQILLDSDLAEVSSASSSRLTAALRSAKIGDAGRAAVVVQIESMLDIGHSASVQLEIAEARREMRRSNVDPNTSLAEETKTQGAATSADHMADFQAQEDDKVMGTTVFPRRMLRLELSDGRQKVTAIELQRIPGLDMNTTRMGAKLLLKGVNVKDGYALLTPQTVGVEGGAVDEKDSFWEEKLIERLRAQLGKPKEDESGPRGRPIRGPEGAESGTNAREKRGFSPDDDESALLAALEAEQEMMAVASTSRGTGATANTKLNPPNSNRATTSAAPQSPAAARQRATLVVPDSMQSSNANSRTQVKSSATQENPIAIIDSDDEVFADVPDEAFAGLEDVEMNAQTKRKSERSGETKPGASNSWAEPIVIDSD